MIFEVLFNIIMTLFDVVFFFFDLPDFPVELSAPLDTLLLMCLQVVGVIIYFFTPSFLLVLFTLIIVFVNFKHIYDFVMFILSKIPFLGIGG